MNAHGLLAHFERISDAPDAVARLRRFILDLAVRGKLVEQDSRESTEPSEAPAAEEPFPLPSNWSCVALGGVLHMINGRAFKPSDWLSKGLPIVRIQNLNNESSPFNCCDPRSVDEKHIIEDGTFLISWSGTPGTSFGAFIWQRGKAALNQHIFKCLPAGAEYHDRFLQLAINGRLDEMIAKAHGGVGLQHITKGKLEALALPLPPLAEQHRIVAKVDELMQLCDLLEASQAERETRRDRLVVSSLSRLSQPTNLDEFKKDAGFHLRNLNRLSTKPEHIKELRKAILNLAVSGTLTKWWRDNTKFPEDAHALLERLLRERRSRWEQDQLEAYAAKGKAAPSKWQSRYLEPAAPCTDSLPPLPQEWTWVTVEQISSKVTDGVHKKPSYINSGVPFLKVTNLTAGPGISFSNTSFVSEEDHNEFCRRTLPEKGDLLVTKDGTLGVVRAIRTDRPFSIFVSLALVKPLDTELTDYLEIAMASPVVQEQMIGTGSGLQHIHLQDLRKDCVPLPPLAEQKRIVAKVDELMAICDQLEKQLESQQKCRRRLLEALLHEALEGGGEVRA
jgi:type I restriction enzyme S subunit